MSVFILSPRRLLVIASALSIAIMPINGVARADSDLLRRAIIGLGAAAIANESQRRQGTTRQGTTRQSTGSTRAGSSPSSARSSADAARVAEARDMQGDLAALGFDVGPVDGRPGPRTRRAIEAFQVNKGFAPTGTLSAPQRLVLDSDAARATGDTRAVERLAVLETQTYLLNLGYDTGRPDGAWGPRSQRALDRFRADTATGTPGVPVTAGDMSLLYGRVHGVPPVSNRIAGANLPQQGTFGAAPVKLQPSFNCSRAAAGAEQAICGSNRLAALDLELARSWTAMSRAQGGTAAILPRQRAWLAQRNNCGADVSCIEASLRQRIGELGGDSAAALASVATLGAPVDERGERDIFAGLETSASSGPDGISSGLVDQTSVATDAERIHVQGGRIIRAPSDATRRLALLAIARDPALLAEDRTVEAMMMATATPAQVQAYREMNALRKSDRIATEREALLRDAQTVLDVTSDAPIHVAIHIPMRPGPFVEGVGLTLQGDGAIDVILKDRVLPTSGARLRGTVPVEQNLPLSRDEASALLDRLEAGRREGRGLVRVVRGQMTSFGTDETIEDFAAQATNRSVPTTFVIEDAAIQMIRTYQDTGVEDLLAGAERLHVWTPEGRVSTALKQTGQTDALALARSLGLPIEDGHVLAEGNGNWTQFNALALLGREPGLARNDGGFVRVAALLLPEDQRRAFFGDKFVTAGNQTLQFFLQGNASYLDNVFPDEFTRRDAERSFYANYFDGIMARTPSWPMPVRQKIEARLGEYDFEQERFPLQYFNQSGGQSVRLRVVSLPAADNHLQGWGGLVSADRMSGFPEFLNLPPEKARILRQVAQNNSVYLAWWADFDWSNDGAAMEKRFAAAERSNKEVRTGRANLKRIALFADAALTSPILEIAPTDVLLQAPTEPEEAQAPPAPVIPVENLELSAIKLSGVEEIMGHGARLLGTDTAYDVLARGHQNARQANEFEVAGVVEQVKAQMQAGSTVPIWVSGTIDLGRYDLDTGTFDMGGTNTFSLRQRTGGVNITVEMIGPNPFRPLAVPSDLARTIVEGGHRQVTYYAEIMPEAANPDRSWPDQPNLTVLARPRQIIFFKPEGRNLQDATVLGRHSMASANAQDRERLARSFDAEQFSDLAGTVLSMDTHVMDLLAIASGATPDDTALDAMMAAAWWKGPGGAGPAFFEEGEPFPDPSQQVLYRPSFRSWLTAKAGALGDTFKVQIVSRPQNWCQQAVVLSQIPNNRAIAALLGDVSNSVNRLNQTLSQAEGPVRVDERYAQFAQRPASARENGCEQWGGILRLTDVVHEHPATQRYQDAVEVVFTVTEVIALPNDNQAMDVFVTGRASKTWTVSENGQVGEEILPYEPKPEAEEVAVVQPAPISEAARQQAQAARAAEAEAKALADAQAEIAAQKADAEWLDASGLDVATSTRDVVGLYLGQDMASAHETVTALPGVLAGFETVRPSEKDKTGLLAYQRVYVRRDGTETIILAGPAPVGPVLAIIRRLVEAERALPLDQIEASVVDKYGPPDSDLSDEWGVSIWASAPAESCVAMADDVLEDDRMTEIATVAPAQNRKLRDVLAQGWSMAPPNLAPGAATGAAACGEVLAFGLERPLDWGHSGFNLTLIDMTALAALESADAAEPDGFEIDF